MIGVWFDATVKRLDQAQAEAARHRADGRDAAANMLTARTLSERRLFIDDARMLAHHLWRAARTDGSR